MQDTIYHKTKKSQLIQDFETKMKIFLQLIFVSPSFRMSLCIVYEMGMYYTSLIHKCIFCW